MGKLRLVLWIVGIGCLLSLGTLLLPYSAVRSVAEALGGQDLPCTPAFVYAIRAIAATYVSIGVFYVILAISPTRYGIMVPFSGAAGAAVGLSLAVFGISGGLPVLWYLPDAVFCVVLGALIIVFWWGARGERAPAGRTAEKED